MDVELIKAARRVIVSYCDYLLDKTDYQSLAEDMRSLLLSLPEDVREDIISLFK
jgi:hypothetical protein